MKEEQIGKPVIAVVNSFTQFVPGHTHLHEIGQFVKQEIEKLGCFAAEFNTIAIDDGIAMCGRILDGTDEAVPALSIDGGPAWLGSARGGELPTGLRWLLQHHVQ